jgi:hypothetical protein
MPLEKNDGVCCLAEAAANRLLTFQMPSVAEDKRYDYTTPHERNIITKKEAKCGCSEMSFNNFLSPKLKETFKN